MRRLTYGLLVAGICVSPFSSAQQLISGGECTRYMTKELFNTQVLTPFALATVQREVCNVPLENESKEAFTRTIESCSRVINIATDNIWEFYGMVLNRARDMMAKGLVPTPDCNEIRQAAIQSRNAITAKQSMEARSAQSTGAGSVWRKAFETGDQTYFLDKRIERGDDIRNVRAMIDYKNPLQDGALSSALSLTFHCKINRYRFLGATGFTEHMGNGSVVTQETNKTLPWKEINPDGALGAIFRMACA